MRRSLGTAAAALLVSAAALSGQERGMAPRASRFEIGVYAGGALTSKWFESRTVTTNGTPTPTENDDAQGFAPGFGGAFGAQLSYFLTPALGVRLHGAYTPMHPPRTVGAFQDATDAQSYTLNSYLYDLGLVLRPFVTRDAWLRSLYLFAGGGGLTVDVAGTDGPACEAGLLALGACLSREPAQATVAQGTVGAGMDLLQLTSSLGLFGELGVHAYDSPVHTDDEWVGPITVGPNTQVRVADDWRAVTARLVLGVKLSAGNLLTVPPPAPPPPPPPPTAPPPPPPPNGHHPMLQVCVVQQDGMLANVPADYNPTTGDTIVGGRRFSEAHPTGAMYAAPAMWFINNEPISVGGRRYVKYGLPRVLAVSEVSRTGDYMGVGVFVESGAAGTPEVIYLPVRPGCEFQPYQLERKTGAVRG